MTGSGHGLIFSFGIGRDVEVVQHFADGRVAVGGIHLHGSQDGVFGARSDVGVQPRRFGERFGHTEDGFGGHAAREQVVERGAERIDVRAGREARQAVAVVLLDGGEALREGQRGGACLLIIDVVAFADAEVDQSGVVVLVDQDIARLDVEMEDVFGVYKLQRAPDLVDVFKCARLRQLALVFEQRLERSARDALHSDVGRVVFLEDFEDIHDVRVVHFREDARLLDLPLAKLVEQPAPRLRMHADLHRGGVSEAVIFEEIFLDTNRYGGLYGSQFTLDFGVPNARISDSESALSDDLCQTIFPVLQAISFR